MAGGSSGGGARGGGGSGESGKSGGPGGGPRSGESGAAAKAAAKSPWHCKSCSTPGARGFRKLSLRGCMQCKWCNMPKSSHFGGKPAQAAPSRNNAEVKLAQALDELKQLKAAAAQPGAGGGSAPGGGTPPWREGAAAGGEKRQRLEQLDKQLGEIRRWADMEDEGGELVEAARSRKATLEAERDQLRQEVLVFQAKPKDVQLNSLTDQIKKLEKQQEKGRGEMVAVAAQQKELDAKAGALRLADAEREAKLAELRAEQVEGPELSANFLGDVLGSIGIERALHASLLEQATKVEQQRREARATEAAAAAAARAAERVRAPIPGEGVPAGGDAMGDEELDVDTQLSFLTKVGAAPAGAEGTDRAMAGSSGNGVADDNELYEADEQ
ncbi:unnamed protein product, partial [Prorocentrum cordatum]